MAVLAEAAREFLSQRRIAVAGVSREQANAGNIIYRRLRDSGYEVFAVNPAADEVEGDRCYRSLAAIPGGVTAVVVATHPDVAEAVVQDCVAAGVSRVWLHRSFGRGSVSAAAVELGAREGVAVIDGGCPMMFMDPVDVGHRCIRWLLGVAGRLPDGARY
jgi:uncharacterized protein